MENYKVNVCLEKNTTLKYIKVLKENLLLEQAYGVNWYIMKDEMSKSTRLKKLKEKYSRCMKCPLSKTRINFVFGDGDPEAEIMFIGEAPGYDEDRQGLPFVGKAGMLLEELIKNILKLKRENVYISNIVKCHPMHDPMKPELRGNDRPPNKLEIEACLPIIQEQIDIISPKIIIVLGNIATESLLNIGLGVTKIHGRVYEYKNIKVIPTYHPAAVLRNPQLKQEIINDFKKIKSYI